MQYVMHLAGAAIEAQFNIVGDDRSMPSKAYEWRPFRDSMGQWSGQIDFVCTTTKEIETIYTKLHGSGIELHGTCSIIEVENRSMDLGALALNNISPPAPSSPFRHTRVRGDPG